MTRRIYGVVVGYVKRQSLASSIDVSCRCKLLSLTMTIITRVTRVRLGDNGKQEGSVSTRSRIPYGAQTRSSLRYDVPPFSPQQALGERSSSTSFELSSAMRMMTPVVSILVQPKVRL